MALTFGGATSDRVECGTDSSTANLSTFTSLLWVYPTANDSYRRLWQRGVLSTSAGGRGFSHGNGGGYAANITAEVSYTTTSALLAADISNFANYSLNAWNCIGVTIDLADMAGSNLWVGNLSAVVAAPSAYATRRAGTGSLGTNTTDVFKVANNPGNNSSFVGRIAWIGLWNRRLTLQELIEQQWTPHVTAGCVMFTHFGYNGTGTQVDWSGYLNNGTVTGATLTPDHVPLWWPPAGQQWDSTPFPTGTSVSAQPGNGALIFTGYPAVVETPRSLRPGTGDLTLAGDAAAVETPRDFLPGTGDLTLAGDAAAVETPRDLQPGTGDLTLTGDAASLELPRDLQPGTGDLTLAGDVPTVEATSGVRPGTAAVSLTGYAPIIEVPRDLQPGAGAVTLTGYAPTVETGVLIHRHWRINVTAVDGGTFAQVNELIFRATPGGTRLTPQALCSSRYDYDARADVAYDDNAATMWASLYPTTLPQWIGYDFGAGNSLAIVEISWKARGDAFYDESPADADIQYSDNGSAWNTAWSFSGESGWTAGSTHVLTSPDPGSVTAHRYWRVYVTASQGTVGAACQELQLRAAVGGADQTGVGPTASSEYSGGFAAHYAFDADNATGWATTIPATLPVQLAWDFGVGGVEVQEVAIRNRATDNFTSAPKDFDVQYSDDGSVWYTLWSVSGSTGWGNNELRTFTKPLTASRTPGTGEVTFSGGVPQVLLATILTPGTGELALAGDAPVLSVGVTARPGTGALTLTGDVPDVSVSISVQPGTGALTLVAYRPGTGWAVDAQPGRGQVYLTGDDALVSHGRLFQPGTGSVQLTGAIPGVDRPVTPGSGDLGLAGAPPLVETPYFPGSAGVVLTGYPPRLVLQTNRTPQPGTAALILTGNPPRLQTANIRVTPGTGLLILTGYGMSRYWGTATGALNLDVTVTPSLGLNVEVSTPLDLQVEIEETGPGSLSLTDEWAYDPFPWIASPTVLGPPTASVTLQGYPPTGVGNTGGAPSSTVVAIPGDAHLVIAGYVPTVTPTLAGGTGDLVVIGYPPGIAVAAVARAASLRPGTGQVALTGRAGTVVVTVSGYAPDILDLNLAGAYIDASGYFRHADGSLFSPSLRNPWANGETIVDDPNGAGMGRVVRIHYQNFALDRAFGLASAPALAFGQEFYAAGDFFFEDDAWALAGGKIEQLLATAGFQYVVYFRAYTAELGTQIVLNNSVGFNGNGRWGDGSKDLVPAYRIQSRRKYHYERRIKANSGYGVKDGELQLWLDGVSVLNESGIDYYRTNNGNTIPRSFSFGTQVNNTASAIWHSYRTWGDVKLSTHRIGG